MSQLAMDFDTYQAGPVFSPKSYLAEARKERDEALEQVVTNAGDDWKQKALNVLRTFSRVTGFIGEDVRLACEAQGIFPHHANAWGGLIATAVKQGLIEATGEYRSPKSKKTHARKSQVYRRV